MGEHGTWFDFLPGYPALKHALAATLGREWTWQVFQATHFDLVHVVGGLLVLLLLGYFAMHYSATVRKAPDGGVVPPPRFGARNFMELLGDTVYGLMEGAMGKKEIPHFLPIIGSLFLFILFSNLLALIPGFFPPTGVLNTNIALAVLVFVLTHVYGVKVHGIKYFKHFLGPVWWLAWLMLPIEVISHIARPISLSIRLLGNITADHKVVAVFFAMVPLLIPVPFLLMGVFVSVVQAVVFSLLAAIYIGSAVAHEDH